MSEEKHLVEFSLGDRYIIAPSDVECPRCHQRTMKIDRATNRYVCLGCNYEQEMENEE